jgi:hypothetical protein
MVHTRTAAAAMQGSEVQNVAGQVPAFKVVFVRYHDTIKGHESFGRAIGTACRTEICESIAQDAEVKLVLKIVTRTVRGKALYADYLATLKEVYPEYLAELKGIRAATGVPLKTLLCSCLRQVPKISSDK